MRLWGNHMNKLKNNVLKNMDTIACVVIGYYVFDFVLRDIFGQFFLNANLVFGLISIFTVLYLIYCTVEKKFTMSLTELLLISAIFLWTIISMARGNAGLYAYRIYAAHHFIWFYLIYTYVRCQRDDEKGKRNVNMLVFVILVVCSIVTFLSFALFVVETGFGYDLHLQSWSGKLGNGSRFTGILSNPNPLGHLAFMATAAAMYLYTEFKSKAYKFILIGSIVVNVAIILLTGCRSALVALGGVLLVAFYQLQKKITFKKPWIKFVIYAVLVGIIVLVGYRVLGLNRFGGASALQGDTIKDILNKITSARYEIWLETAQLAKSSPIFGSGYGNLYDNASLVLGNHSIIVQSQVGVAHNIFLELYYSAGLLGLALFVGYCIFLIGKCVTTLKLSSSIHSAITIGVLFGLFLISQLDVGILYSGSISPMFWLFAAIVVSESERLRVKQ